MDLVALPRLVRFLLLLLRSWSRVVRSSRLAGLVLFLLLALVLLLLLARLFVLLFFLDLLLSFGHGEAGVLVELCRQLRARGPGRCTAASIKTGKCHVGIWIRPQFLEALHPALLQLLCQLLTLIVRIPGQLELPRQAMRRPMFMLTLSRFKGRHLFPTKAAPGSLHFLPLATTFVRRSWGIRWADSWETHQARPWETLAEPQATACDALPCAWKRNGHDDDDVDHQTTPPFQPGA